MLNNSIDQELPPGLLDHNMEIFASGNRLMALYNGSIVKFDDLPAEIIRHFYAAMHKNTVAMTILSKLFSSEKEMLHQFAWCNFGGWNRRPDYDSTANPEYWDCGNRGKCKHEGKLCIKINADEKNLTQRELEVSKLIAQGLADKEIAYKLQISYFTVTTMRQKIEHKINAQSKVGIASFVHTYNLLGTSLKH